MDIYDTVVEKGYLPGTTISICAIFSDFAVLNRESSYDQLIDAAIAAVHKYVPSALLYSSYESLIPLYRRGFFRYLHQCVIEGTINSPETFLTLYLKDSPSARQHAKKPNKSS